MSDSILYRARYVKRYIPMIVPCEKKGHALKINMANSRFSPPCSPLVPEIRNALRDLVREFGFMKSTLAGTEFSPSAMYTFV
jgi:hypothetical protein